MLVQETGPRSCCPSGQYQHIFKTNENVVACRGDTVTMFGPNFVEMLQCFYLSTCASVGLLHLVQCFSHFTSYPLHVKWSMELLLFNYHIYFCVDLSKGELGLHYPAATWSSPSMLHIIGHKMHSDICAFHLSVHYKQLMEGNGGDV